MSELLRGRRRDWVLWALLSLLLITRACAWGVQYWPQLDDYIQLHNIPTAESFWGLQETMGILGARPLAGMADYYFWGPMFGFLIVGVGLISMMYAACAVLLRRQLGRYFPVGPVFLAVFALLPLGVEGTYWMSASTRVVCGLFFAVLAAQTFLRWMDTGRWYWAVLYLILQLLPMGFYEQAGIFSVTLTVGLAILEVIRSRGRLPRALVSLWGLPALKIYFMVTGLFSDGSMFSSRSELIFPNEPYWRNVFLPQVLEQFREVFVEGNFYTLAKGFVRGVRSVLAGPLLPGLLAAAVLCVLLWLALSRPEPRKAEGEGEKPLSLWLEAVAGILLTVGPLTVFLVVGNPWFSFRGAVSAFGGLALLADLLVTAVWRRLPGFQRGPAALCALCALVFWVAGASEVGDYKATYENDQQVAAQVLDVLESEISDPDGLRVGVLNVEPSYLPNQNYYYHEHIHGCTESAWAFQGLLTCLGDGVAWDVTPLPAAPVYYLWNQATSRPETFDVLYLYDHEQGSVERVTLEQTGEHDFLVLDGAGEPVGVIWEESDGLGYFRMDEKT